MNATALFWASLTALTTTIVQRRPVTWVTQAGAGLSLGLILGTIVESSLHQSMAWLNTLVVNANISVV